uniref:Uncharacterized protein n=1 Tax=Varanus komodoensis TaxID=61221 RepID=A0A8D2LA77_VARKO
MNLKEKERRDLGLQWDLDVQPLISSAKWLQLHGLKRNKLTFSQILSQIGFQHKQDYVSILGKLVASRYANGLYHQYTGAPDGKLYNLTAKKELLFHFVDCLTGTIELYKQRMEWLTTESRQIFGVIQEQIITIVLDFGVAPRAEFDLCREALSMILKQQVAQIARFNLICGGQDLVKWQEKAVPVTEDSIDAAIEWLWMMDHMPAVCHMGPTEALLEALNGFSILACSKKVRVNWRLPDLIGMWPKGRSKGVLYVGKKLMYILVHGMWPLCLTFLSLSLR